MKVGIGYDIHALVPGRKLVLGGVHVPHSKGLKGHSDGDALLHALVDACLGAAGIGDIGDLFPDNDPKWKGVDSAVFVAETLRQLAAKKLAISNVDAVIVAEEPRLGAYKEKIKRKVAERFKIDPSCVGIKAKTHEGFGAIGEGLAIACYAVVSLIPAPKRRKK